MIKCVYTRSECHHKGCKCSECPITDLICDEFNDCLDLSYEQGKTELLEELKPFVHNNCEGQKFIFVNADDCKKLGLAKLIKEKSNE